MALNQFHAFYGQRLPVSTLTGFPANTEPLPGYRVTILESRVANISRMHARVFCQLVGDPARVGSDFLDPQPVMLAIAAEIDIQQFSDDEI